MAQLPGGVPYIRQSDLQDPTLALLNNLFAQIFSELPSASASPSWIGFAPSFGGSLTLNTFVSNEAQYQHINYMVFLNVDITFTIASGTSAGFTVAYPVSYPPASTNSFGDVLGCLLIIGGAEVPALARVTNGSILVQRSDGANLATGVTRVLISGFYRTSN